MEIAQLKNFIAKLSVLEYKNRIQREAEETFNIFSVLHKEREEVRLHSRFISNLLSPTSPHNMKNRFLELFLEVLNISDFNSQDINVIPNEANWSEYKEIDILLINRKDQNAIIIENKIDARDSNHEDRGQLEGYFNILLQEGIPQEKIHVFYLTLDRHEPSSESLGKYGCLENMNGYCIDYGTEITQWIEKCIKEVPDKPALRETLIQYLKLISKMTNNITEKDQLELRDLIAFSKENMLSSKILFDNFKHIKWHTVNDFWTDIVTELKRRGYSVLSKPTNQNITDTTHLSPNSYNYANKNDYGIHFNYDSDAKIYIWNGTGDDWLFWGIDDELDEAIKGKINKFAKENANVQISKSSALWKYFDFKDDENIFLPDFSFNGTYNLIQADYRAQMIGRMIDEIENYMHRILHE